MISTFILILSQKLYSHLLYKHFCSFSKILEEEFSRKLFWKCSDFFSWVMLDIYWVFFLQYHFQLKLFLKISTLLRNRWDTLSFSAVLFVTLISIFKQAFWVFLLSGQGVGKNTTFLYLKELCYWFCDVKSNYWWNLWGCKKVKKRGKGRNKREKAIYIT